MASPSVVSKTRFHARSISLPSEPHQVVHEYDEILSRLSSSGAACSSSSGFTVRLDELQDLHYCLDSVLSLPETRQALAKDCHGKWVDELLNGTLTLLDVCGTARDTLLMTKECAQELQSSLRRRGDTKAAAKYLICRKVVKKLIKKALKSLKGLHARNKEQDSLFAVSMIREVQQVTLSIIESFLTFVSGPKDQSLVSLLMNSNRTHSETTNEFDMTEAAVQSIVKNKAAEVDSIHALLADLESSIEDIEFGVESLNKHLIRTRVNLLNILSH